VKRGRKFEALKYIKLVETYSAIVRRS